MSNNGDYVKHYAGDWAKAKSRDLQREMIQEILLTFRNPKDLKVLFFPGIDACEVYEVYDPLGIPRENLYGLERESKIADALDAKGLGINILRNKRGRPLSLEEYLAGQTGIEYDIISLDYVGPLSFGQLRDLWQIRRKQKRNNFIFHCANLTKRDRSMLELYSSIEEICQSRLSSVVSSLESTGDPFSGYDRSFFERVINITREKSKKVKEEGTTFKERSYSYYRLIENAFLATPSVSHENLFQWILNSEDRDCKTEEVRNFVRQAFPKQSPGHNLRGDIDAWDMVLMSPEFNSLLASKVRLRTKEFIAHTFASTFYEILKEGIGGKLFYMKDTQHYSYISESGATMIGEVCHAVTPKDRLNAAQEVALTLGYPKQFYKNNSGKVIDRVRDWIREYNHFLGLLKGGERRSLDDRVFLGNAAKKILTKQRFIEELEGGLDIEEIKEKYRGWQNKPLAQWKAHHTMGTYRQNQKETTQEEIIEDPEDATIEKITKDDAIDFLRLNVPPEEIYELYPTSFSLGRLRAFKAHLTMGTYKNGETEAKI